MPESAKAFIDNLSAAGYLGAYSGDVLGANELITPDELSALVKLTDDHFNTVKPGESFYWYVNNKAFRNAQVSNMTTLTLYMERSFKTAAHSRLGSTLPPPLPAAKKSS